jgi:hypothetical protein
MPNKMVTADIPENGLSSAALGLGVPLGKVNRSGLVRAALALFHGMDRDTAITYLDAAKPSRLGSKGQDLVSAYVPEELADVGETNRAYAIRVGLALAAGATKEQAESWATFGVRKVGYQHKEKV